MITKRMIIIVPYIHNNKGSLACNVLWCL